MTSQSAPRQTRLVDDKSSQIERREGRFEGKYGDELFFQSWTPVTATGMGAAGPPTSPIPEAGPAIVITHGIGEHSECYSQLARALVSHGWHVYAWDLRGHGRSSGKRGYVHAFRDYMDDLGAFVEFLQTSRHMTTSYAILGHSMGALITLKYALDQGPSLAAKAMILSSPLLGIAVPVPVIKEVASRLLLKLAPGLTLFNEIKYEQLTHDPEILKTYPYDSLRHEKICPTIYEGMLSTIRDVAPRGSELRVPVLIQAAGTDLIVSLPETEKFYPTIGSAHKKLIVYKDDFHEIYNELDRATVYADLQAFLKSEFTA